MKNNYKLTPEVESKFLPPSGGISKTFRGWFNIMPAKWLPRLFTLLFLGAASQAFAQDYCIPAPPYTDGDGIVNVTIGTINNSTQLEEANYGNFSDQIASVGRGVTQPFTVGLNTYSAYNVKIWIDWNDNFTFDDNEEVADIVSANVPRATVSGNFTVPVTATLGNHRLRIGAVADFNGPATPCYEGYNAAYEDYTINVTPAPSCYAPLGLAYVNTAPGTSNLSWTAPTLGTVAGYQYAITTTYEAPSTFTSTTATAVTGVSVPLNTPAFFHVRTNCGGSDFSTWATIPFYNGVCIPSPDYTDSDGITNFKLGTINNTTGDEPGHYGDYTTLAANIGQGVTAQFNMGFNTFSDHIVRIWIDWNNDQDFDDEGEEVYAGNSEGGEFTTLTGTFTVPANASLGNHRLRIGINPYYADPPTPCFEAAGSGSFEDYTLNVVAPPSCFTPLNPVGVNVSEGVANISWTAPSLGATPAGYQYAVTTSSTPPATYTSVTSTTVANVSVTPNAVNYIHVRTNCGGNDFSDWFTDSFFNGYCIPRPAYVDGQGITNVSIGAINNPSENEDNQYGDYTSQVVNVGQGVTQQFNISLFTYASYNVKIWVDLNNDLDFDDEGEEVYTGLSAPTTRTILTGYFTVPLTAALGNHRLRIGAVPAYVDPAQPCFVEYYGAYEDYTINVTTPPSCYTPTGLGGTSSTAGLVNISWTAPALGNAPAGYQYAITATPAAPTTYTDITTTTALNVPVTSNVIVYLHVRTNCGGNDFSEWVTVSYYNGVCIPEPAYVDGAGITNVTIGSINNTTGREESFYGDYSSLSANIGQTVVQPFKIGLNTYSAYNVKIWVDFNNDLDFDDADEELYSGTSADALSTILRGTITIPANAPLGSHRLRIAISPTYTTPPTPCSVEFAGTYEDYTINVTGPPTCFIPIDPIAAATASGVANFSWNAPAQGDAPVGYDYYIDTNNVIVTPITTTTTATTTVTGYTGFADNTYYYLHVRTKCGEGDFSEWVTSDGFRYLQGDTCESAIDLGGLTSPYTFSTEGADDNYTPYCAQNSAPDLLYSITVPNGFIFSGSFSETNFGIISALFYGNCTAPVIITCSDDSDDTLTWENVTGSSKTLYLVVDGDYGSFGDFTLTWTLTPPPACDRPRSADVNLTSLTTANITWSAPNTGTPIGYEYAITTSNTEPVNGIIYTTATSATGVAVTPNTESYLYVRAVCGSADGNSAWFWIPFYSGYCIPVNTENEYYITGVSSTGGSTNFSSTNTAFAAYTDYTATHSVSTYAGGMFSLQATTPNTTDGYVYSVWVDWNNNFDFIDTGERVLNTTSLTSPANLGVITIPNNAVMGSYRMRIRNAHIGSPVTPCSNMAGEGEDYTLNIVAPPSCFPPYNLTITPTDTGYANLNWSIPQLGGVPTGYEYVFGPSATAPADGVSGTPSTSFFVGDAEYDPAQSVYLFVRTNCGGGDFSTWAPAQLLGTNSPDFLANTVIVYKEGGAINITSGTTLMKGVTIYDTRGRKLYSQTDINNTETAITGLQIQQQVVIVEVNTASGKVSKRIVF